MTAAAIDPKIAEPLSANLAMHTGLHFPPERWPDLMRGIEGIARDQHFKSVQECASWLLASSLDQHQIESIAKRLTVGETYFFRDPAVFEALRLHILPSLIETRSSSTRRIKIWSAGCSTGEEAYSIAILLDRVLPEPETWNISILATDINPQSLEKARNGCYGDWSFRNPPRWLRDNYFSKTENGQYEIEPQIREKVVFSQFNLAEPRLPMLPGTVDIVFCRNVLMYLAPQTASNVVHNIGQALCDDGWLAVTPAEASLAHTEDFDVVHLDGQILHRKRLGLELLPTKPVHAQPAHLRQPVKNHPREKPLGVEELQRLALELANKGELVKALQHCEKAIADERLNPACHYLYATILQEYGKTEQAVLAFQRALYLNHEFVMAHFALGNLYRHLGRYKASTRHLHSTVRLLEGRDRDDILPESGGMTAGRLMDMTQGFMTVMETIA